MGSQLQALVNTVVDGVVVIDSQGIVRSFNPACERLFGYAAREVIGQNVKILMPSPHRDAHDGYLASYARTGRKQIIGVGREVLGRRKNGGTFPMELSVGEAEQDGQTMFVGVLHDVSERKRVEEALRESAAQMRAVLDTAVDGIILIDGAGVVRMVNPACERMFGYAAAELVGANVKILMPPPYREEHDDFLTNYRLTGERKIIGVGREVVGQRKDGQTFPMELSVGETRQYGEPLFVGVIHDISERKRSEEQRDLFMRELTASNEERGHFVYVASHDLQQHLRMISMFSEMVQSDHWRALDADAVRYLEIIQNAARDMRAVIDDLIVYGRLSADAVRASWFDANDVLQNVLRALQVKIEESSACIRSDPLPQLYGNAVRFSRVLQNIIENSIHYVADEVTPQIAISCEDRGDHYVFSIEDNGIGIGREYLPKVFEPFKRLHSKCKYSGTGLGLAISRKIIDGMGGRIWVESTPNKGSTFSFTIPKVER